MTDGPCLKKLSVARLKTVKILLEKDEFDVAVYLLGYAVEFALKAVICRRLNLVEYPVSGELGQMFKTHEFDTLLVLSGLSNRINANGALKLWKNWSELTEWRPDMRYEPLGTYTRADAERKIKALEDKPYGLLTWIRENKKW